MYHYIGPDPGPSDPHRGLFVPPDEFREQLQLLKTLKRRVLTPSQYSGALGDAQPRQATWITFDDGRRDNYEAAFPILCEAGLTATFFVIVEKSLGGDPRYINISMMREMIAEGMAIGSHTLTHPRLARVPAEQLRNEIAGSRKRLEDALGAPVASFCYPYGNWNQQVADIVRESGYGLAVSTIRDNRNSEKDRWLLKRAMVQPGRTGARFRYLFSPLYHWVHRRKNRRRWN